MTISALQGQKYDMMTSLQTWLKTNLSALPWLFTNEVQATPLPNRVELAEFTDVDPGAQFFNDFVFPASPYNQRGQQNCIRFSFDIYAEKVASTNNSPKQVVYQTRDQILTALKQAGVFSPATSAVLLPCIELFDYVANPSAPVDTQTVIEFKNGPNDVMEHYFPPSAETPGIHRIQLLVRFYWYELTY